MCYWENSAMDGEGQCQFSGPQQCVWDCEGICDWLGLEENAHDPGCEDPINFCDWVLNTVRDGDCANDCTGHDATDVQMHIEQCEACIESDNPNSEECGVFCNQDECYCYSVDNNNPNCEQYDDDYDECMGQDGCDFWCDHYEDCAQYYDKEHCEEYGCTWDENNMCVDNDGHDHGDEDMEQWYCEHENGIDWYTSSEECNQECGAECIFSQYGDAPACLEDCTGFNDWAHVNISDNPDAFCYWLTDSFVSSDCTDDCAEDEDAEMITAYHNACIACLDTNNGCQNAIDELDHIYDDNDYTTSFTLFPDITIIKMTDEFGNDVGVTGEGDDYAGCWDADLYNINGNRNSSVFDIEPLTTMLGPIYPNPFNSVTTLPIELSEIDTLSVFVIDNNNEKVCDIVNNESFNMGVHSLLLNMSDCITNRSSNYYRLIVDFGSYECFQNMEYYIP